jgi:hypothetical protein
MKHIKLFEEFEAYNEFGLSDPHNVELAKKELKKKGIKFEYSEGGGFTFFVFNSSTDLDKGVDAIEKVIDKSLEDEWH